MSGCSRSEKHFEDTRLILGTVVTIKAFGPEAKIAVTSGFSKMEELEQVFDQHAENTEITKLNAYSRGIDKKTSGPIKISKDLLEVINIGLKYSDKTKGKYDITIGPLVDLWKTKEKTKILPMQKEIDEIKNFVDYKKLKLNVEQGTIKMEQGMVIDLGSISKGYIVDQAMEEIKGYNINGAIIDAGGGVLTLGANLKGKWKVGIINPQKVDSLLGYLIFDGNRAVVSSGNYQQYYLINEQKYGHILNLDSGWPANEVLSVSVFGTISVMADVLSTAVFVVGVKDGLQLIKEANYEGLIVDRLGELHMTKGFKQYFEEI